MRKIGTVVKVKKGEAIPDLNIDQTGWRGRISDRGQDRMLGIYYCVEWDSITLENIGNKQIYRMHKNNKDWTKDIFGRGSIIAAKERDTEEDVKSKVKTLKTMIKNREKRLQRILNTKKP